MAKMNPKQEMQYNLYMEHHYLEPKELESKLSKLEVKDLVNISHGGCIPVINRSKKQLINNIVYTVSNRKRIREEASKVYSQVEWY